MTLMKIKHHKAFRAVLGDINPAREVSAMVIATRQRGELKELPNSIAT